MRLLFLAAALVAVTSSTRHKRGVVEEMGNLFEGLHSGFGHFQKSATEELSRLKPWAANLEREMKPAMARVEEEFGSALDKFGFNFGQDRVDSHVMDTSGIPGLGSMLGANLDPFSLFGLARKNWWEGPNVCIDRKVFEEDSDEGDEEVTPEENRKRSKFFAMDMSFTSCRDDFNFHECTSQINRNGVKKTVTVRHQCCYGYERSTDGTTGCDQMVMEDLPSTLRGMGVSEFTALLEENGMMDQMKNNVTVFAPSDDAIEDFRHDLQQLNSLENEKNSYNIDDGLSYRKKRELTIVETPALDEILMNHMVEGFLDTADIHDEDVLDSVTGHKIRMTVYNTYPQRAVMANCAKVTSRDHYSKNGVVHIVDKVMMPATKTLREMVESDVQLSSLKAVLEKSNLLERLAEPGQWTLLAPSNNAFNNLNQETIARLEKGNGCSKDILLHHLLPNVICTGVIEGKARTVNVNEKYVVLERDIENQLTVDNVKIITRDVMGTNGVIHIIEEVLIPETARTVEEAMEENHMTTLQELFEAAGMAEVLNDMSNLTIFAPSEKALSALPDEMVEDMKNNPEKLRDFLMYHITTPKTCKCDMSNNKVLKTGVRDQQLRINTYGGVIPLMDKTPNVITAQCARITNLDSEVCGGLIHTVDKVLMPPIGNFMDVMKLDPKHTEWVKLVQAAGMEEELNDHTGPLTMLAPTDGAFANMNDEEKRNMFENEEVATQVVKHHMLREMLCCAGINRNFMFFDQSTKFTLLEDDIVNVRRSNGGYLYADRAELTTCDMLANNGVIHAIDRVLLPLNLRPHEHQDRPEERIASNPHGYRFNNPLNLFKNFNIRFQ